MALPDFKPSALPPPYAWLPDDQARARAALPHVDMMFIHTDELPDEAASGLKGKRLWALRADVLTQRMNAHFGEPWSKPQVIAHMAGMSGEAAGMTCDARIEVDCNAGTHTLRAPPRRALFMLPSRNVDEHGPTRIFYGALQGRHSPPAHVLKLANEGMRFSKWHEFGHLEQCFNWVGARSLREVEQTADHTVSRYWNGQYAVHYRSLDTFFHTANSWLENFSTPLALLALQKQQPAPNLTDEAAAMIEVKRLAVGLVRHGKNPFAKQRPLDTHQFLNRYPGIAPRMDRRHIEALAYHDRQDGGYRSDLSRTYAGLVLKAAHYFDPSLPAPTRGPQP